MYDNTGGDGVLTGDSPANYFGYLSTSEQTGGAETRPLNVAYHPRLLA